MKVPRTPRTEFAPKTGRCCALVVGFGRPRMRSGELADLLDTNGMAGDPSRSTRTRALVVIAANMSYIIDDLVNGKFIAGCRQKVLITLPSSAASLRLRCALPRRSSTTRIVSSGSGKEVGAFWGFGPAPVYPGEAANSRRLPLRIFSRPPLIGEQQNGSSRENEAGAVCNEAVGTGGNLCGSAELRTTWESSRRSVIPAKGNSGDGALQASGRTCTSGERRREDVGTAAATADAADHARGRRRMAGG